MSYSINYYALNRYMKLEFIMYNTYIINIQWEKTIHEKMDTFTIKNIFLGKKIQYLVQKLIR